MNMGRRDVGRQLARSQEISTKVSVLFQRRAKTAQENFAEALKKAYGESGVGAWLADPASAASLAMADSMDSM